MRERTLQIKPPIDSHQQGSLTIAADDYTLESEAQRKQRLPVWSITRRLITQAGIDRAVLFGILSAIRGLAAGPVTALLIIAYFTPELQGYYYTFNSLLALQIFVELGLGVVIVQFASHEWSKLQLDESGSITGSPEALSRLVSLGQVAFRWYAVAGALLVVGLGAAGFLFFSHATATNLNWMVPWFTLCVLTGINLCLIPVWSLLEGCNQVSEVYGYRLIQGMLSTIAIWVAIFLGAKLWTIAIALTVSLGYSLLFLRRKYWQFFRPFFSSAGSSRVGWSSEIWPLQWKIALSWVSGYFCFWTFTPILFHYRGPVVAGQMGLTWSLISVISAISSLWVMTKVPQFGILVAKKNYAELDRLFLKLLVASFGVALSGAVAIWSVIFFLNRFNYHLASRFLPPLPTGLFLIATLLLQISVSQSAYLRAHKKEPFLLLSMLGGLLIGLSNWLLGSRYSATGMAFGYLAVVALVNIPGGTLIWQRCRTNWHSDAPEE